MTKAWVPGALLILLLTAPMVSAHSAPDPRTFETRLLADCIDDIPGSHDGNIIGYDLHSLDVWEFWDGNKEQVGFRLILNGNGDAAITFSSSAGEYGWTHSDDAWSGTGWDRTEVREDVYIDDSSDPVQDGDRFALIGILAKDSLGAAVSGFSIESDSALGADDSMPGNQGSGECNGAFERPDYTIGEKSVEDGYLGEPLDEDDVTLLADEEYFVDVTTTNQVNSLGQQVSMRITDITGGATAEFHAPSSGEYTSDVSYDLKSRSNPGSQRLIHLALAAPEGASGTVTIEITTDVILKDDTTQPGGRLVRTVDYQVEAEEAQVPPGDGADGSGEGPTKETSAPSMLLASVALLVGALWRRR